MMAAARSYAGDGAYPEQFSLATQQPRATVGQNR